MSYLYLYFSQAAQVVRREAWQEARRPRVPRWCNISYLFFIPDDVLSLIFFCFRWCNISYLSYLLINFSYLFNTIFVSHQFHHHLLEKLLLFSFWYPFFIFFLKMCFESCLRHWDRCLWMLFYHPLFKVILLRRNISHFILNSIGANLSIVQLSNIFQKPESEGCRKIIFFAIQNEKYFIEPDQKDVEKIIFL